MTAAILPFVVLSMLVPKPAGVRQPAEIAAAGVLLLSALYIQPNEGLANWQSVWLCSLFALLMLTLVRVRDARGSGSAG
jgi:Na+/H+ antiporter NhaD/arsenite permease-like protein